MQAAIPQPTRQIPAERLIQLIKFRVAYFLYPAKQRERSPQEKIEPSRWLKIISICSKNVVAI